MVRLKVTVTYNFVCGPHWPCGAWGHVSQKQPVCVLAHIARTSVTRCLHAGPCAFHRRWRPHPGEPPQPPAGGGAGLGLHLQEAELCALPLRCSGRCVTPAFRGTPKS